MTDSVGTKPTASLLPHQERVNLEMFKALETLGRRLEKSEDERDRLARRIALIESSATVDEKTGRLYLPVALEQGGHPAAYPPAPKWPVAAILANSAIALFTLGVVLFQQPPQAGQVLTPQQLAALNSLSTRRQFTQFEDAAWKKLSEAQELAAKEESAPVQDVTATPQQLAEVQPAAGPVTAPVEVKPEPKPQQVAEVAPAPVAEPAAAPAPEKENAPIALVTPPAEKPVEKAEVPKPAPQVAKAGEKAPAVTTAQVLETGITPDRGLPAKLAELEKRAFQNVPAAQHDLATLYASGKIVAQDYKRAVYWFSRAADGGIANADYNLGVMFQQGLGVRQDVTKALGWYERAAALGHPEAMYNLGIAYIEGVGTGKNVDKGVAYFKNAANAGVAQAAYNLGVLYESNFIGTIDKAKALDWYQVASNEGHVDAQAAVRRLKTQLAEAEAPAAPVPAPVTDVTPDDTVAAAEDLIEPAAGEVGEGDASPADLEALPPPMPPSERDLVAKIQAALIARGLLPATVVPGALDTVTTDAIRDWQKKSGINPDGQPTQALLDKLTTK